MCIDIDPDSVIHKHLVKKIDDLDESNLCTDNDTYWYNHPILKLKSDVYDGYSAQANQVKHNLTMLDSFHISLGKPPQTEDDKEEFKYYEAEEISHIDIIPVIGDITLAPICISEKDGKKSAWIPLNPDWIFEAFRYTHDPSAYIDYELNLNQFDSFDHRCDECPVKHLHVSIANKTGKPRDSIARPEDCIIDTITS